MVLVIFRVLLQKLHQTLHRTKRKTRKIESSGNTKLLQHYHQTSSKVKDSEVHTGLQTIINYGLIFPNKISLS